MASQRKQFYLLIPSYSRILWIEFSSKWLWNFLKFGRNSLCAAFPLYSAFDVLGTIFWIIFSPLSKEPSIIFAKHKQPFLNLTIPILTLKYLLQLAHLLQAIPLLYFT